MSATAVILLVLAARQVWPDPDLRVDRLYPLVLGLGYGHLIGAALRARFRVHSRFAKAAPARLVDATLVTGLLSAFAAYQVLLTSWPGIVFPLLVLATWHVFENDGVLAQTHRLGRPAAIARCGEQHLLAIGWTLLALYGFLVTLSGDPRLPPTPIARPTMLGLSRAGMLAIGFALVACRAPSRRVAGLALIGSALAASADVSCWPPFGDLFVAVTLYHLISWGLLVARRARWLDLLGMHAPGLLAAASLIALPESSTAALARLFSVEIYLFWSVLHVVQTLVTRGIAPTRLCAAASAPCAGD